MTKGTIPTPALIVDLDALEANIKKMADHCRQAKCDFRPHAKTHKCPAIAQRQMAAGARGICAATVPEAEALAAAGIRGILLTSPIVDAGKIGRMVALASSGGEIMLSVGSLAAGEAAGRGSRGRAGSISPCSWIWTWATAARAVCPANQPSSWPNRWLARSDC